MLYEVAVKSPLRRLFTYEFDQDLRRGTRVLVPFRSRQMMGFIWNKTDVKPAGLKSVARVCDENPLYDEKTLSFYEKSAHYYGASLGELLAGSLPEKIQEGEPPGIFPIKHFVPDLHTLSDAQAEVAHKISSEKNFKTHLLRGEMGSGKTEIYLWLIEKILLEGGQALLLVPEISLTPQLEERLAKRLGGDISVFHSQITEKKRFEVYSRALLGQADIFLGARSALLLPFSNLKLIIVDEEHDNSYKQSERGPYNARDLALLKAQLNNIPIILGSATPSLETYQRTIDSDRPVLELTPYFKKQDPELKIVDLKEAWKENKGSFITNDLQAALEKRLESREQSLIFLNRRGSASQRLCLQCGAVDECKHCSVTLTVHNDLNMAICHWCEFKRSLQQGCQSCDSKEFFMGGIGTKEVEQQMMARFPEARIARLDRDEIQKKKVLSTRLKDFAEGKIDILIGTQIISKGIDIPNLSFVGIVLADQGWNIPDFRSTERSFHLFRQLMGRAGRRGQASEIMIQTFRPEYTLFNWLKMSDPYVPFVQEELAIRKMADLPPYSKLCLWTVSHKIEAQAEADASAFARRLQFLSKSLGVGVIGPTPAPLFRTKGKFRFHILAKAPPKGHLTTLIHASLDEIDRVKIKSQIKIDRDPQQFL